jgi:hypothetical protein
MTLASGRDRDEEASMRANDAGSGDPASVVQDVLGCSGARETVTIRLPVEMMREIRADAKRTGASLTDAIVERLGGRPRRLTSASVANAQAWTAVGYRLTRALDTAERGHMDATIGFIREAQKLVAAELLALRDGYDADVDARDAGTDDWTGRK